MKRLYIIVIALLFALWFNWANDFTININPWSQSAISGSVLNFNVLANNNTGLGVFLTQSFPAQMRYKNANILPINNPALILGLETVPRWVLLSGQDLNLNIQAEVTAQSFPMLSVDVNVVNNNFLVLTSATANVYPIADLMVEKFMVWSGPQVTWDFVTYNILVKNIWSAIATGINLIDVWPNNVVTFPNQWLVDGIIQIPTIYNSLANNYMFSINDLIPWDSASIEIVGIMDSMCPVGQSFVNQAFVLTNSLQYNTWNDNASSTNYVRWLSNLFVNVLKVWSDPYFVWDMITYVINYWNNGLETAHNVILQNTLPVGFAFEQASVVPNIQNANIVSWDLWSLLSWQNDQIILTGRFVGWISIWSSFVNHTQINTPDPEINVNDNIKIVTWYVSSLSEMWIKIYANNLTDPSRNINTWQNILAISGDSVQLQIVLTNKGNVWMTWIISLINLTWFTYYGWTSTGWTIYLDPWISQNIVVDGIVWPKNFVSFSPRVNLTYSWVSLFDSVLIDEPLICGDGLVTQNEVCDTNWQIWNILPWQRCENVNGQCVLVTDEIINTVCMNYTTSVWTGEQCMSVAVLYEEDKGLQCNALLPTNSLIVVNDTNQWSVNLTCSSQNNMIANQIKIDCGNWTTWFANGVSSFTHTCNYVYNPNASVAGNTYTPKCYVDNHTRSECIASVRVDKDIYGVCGDGKLDAWEECDLYWNINQNIIIWNYLDSNQNYLAGIYGNGNYYCRNCRIREKGGQFVYQPPQCLGTNTTISVMENEIFPFWWRLWNRQEQMVSNTYNCNNININETITIINKDSMKCHFAIYDGKNYQQINDNPLNTFIVDCFEKDNSVIFKYFETEYKIDFDKVSGKYVRSMNAVFGGKVTTYWEYKLVLEKVEYQYCDPQTKQRENGRLYQWICEVNFALTRPYIMQISTFGLDPVASSASDFLKDFYDMKWNKLIDSTDISQTVNVSNNTYAFNNSTNQDMLDFKSKYEPLAISINKNFKVQWNKTIWDLFGNWAVKKVPNQAIFFVKWSGKLILKQLTQYFPWSPFTIYVEWMDVLVEWSVKTNWMIIADKKILFEDDSSKDYCEAWWQIVHGIFVAKWWFDSISRTRNNDKTKQRCPWGNLHIKWVLIWDGVQNLMNNRRSHLNDWFRVKSNVELAIKRERRNEIFGWAALLIEYNPALWNALPPWADVFTKSLDVYRK